MSSESLQVTAALRSRRDFISATVAIMVKPPVPFLMACRSDGHCAYGSSATMRFIWPDGSSFVYGETAPFLMPSDFFQQVTCGSP